MHAITFTKYSLMAYCALYTVHSTRIASWTYCREYFLSSENNPFLRLFPSFVPRISCFFPSSRKSVLFHMTGWGPLCPHLVSELSCVGRFTGWPSCPEELKEFGISGGSGEAHTNSRLGSMLSRTWWNWPWKDSACMWFRFQSGHLVEADAQGMLSSFTPWESITCTR